MTDLCPFHLAIPVTDLVAAEEFYCGLLGCDRGRTATRWIDLNFFGHQVTLHLVNDGADTPPNKSVDSESVDSNRVDGDEVPARHFGLVLDMDDWRALAKRLEDAACEFLISPRTRFEGQVGEQATLFLTDPSSNALEFKSFADPTQLFAA